MYTINKANSVTTGVATCATTCTLFLCKAVSPTFSTPHLLCPISSPLLLYNSSWHDAAGYFPFCLLIGLSVLYCLTPRCLIQLSRPLRMSVTPSPKPTWLARLPAHSSWHHKHPRNLDATSASALHYTLGSLVLLSDPSRRIGLRRSCPHSLALTASSVPSLLSATKSCLCRLQYLVSSGLLTRLLSLSM